MKTLLLLLLFCGLWTTLRSQTETNTPIRVSVDGLRIVAKGFGNNDELRPFNYPSGTSISLLVESTGVDIISLNVTKSRVDSVKDDRGADLTGSRVNYSGGFEITDDSKRTRFDIQCFTPPTRGATIITLAGSINLTLGRRPKSHEVKGVKLVKGPLDVNGLKASITEIEAMPAGKGMQLSVRVSGKSTTLVKSIQFLGEVRHPISGRRGNSALIDGREDVSYRNFEFLIPSVTESATFQFDVFSETEVLNVPFQFSIGLGL